MCSSDMISNVTVGLWAAESDLVKTADGRTGYRSAVRDPKLDAKGYVWLQKQLPQGARDNPKLEAQYGADFGENLYDPTKAPIINGRRGTPADAQYVAPPFETSGQAPGSPPPAPALGPVTPAPAGLAGIFSRLQTPRSAATPAPPPGRGFKIFGA